MKVIKGLLAAVNTGLNKEDIKEFLTSVVGFSYMKEHNYMFIVLSSSESKRFLDINYIVDNCNESYIDPDYILFVLKEAVAPFSEIKISEFTEFIESDEVKEEVINVFMNAPTLIVKDSTAKDALLEDIAESIAEIFLRHYKNNIDFRDSLKESGLKIGGNGIDNNEVNVIDEIINNLLEKKEIKYHIFDINGRKINIEIGIEELANNKFALYEFNGLYKIIRGQWRTENELSDIIKNLIAYKLDLIRHDQE